MCGLCFLNSRKFLVLVGGDVYLQINLLLLSFSKLLYNYFSVFMSFFLLKAYDGVFCFLF